MTEINWKLSEDELKYLFESLEKISRESSIVKIILSAKFTIEKKIFFALNHGIQIGKGDFSFEKEKDIDDILKENDYEKLGHILSNVNLTSDVAKIISCLDITEEKKINIALRLGIGQGTMLVNIEISKYLLPKSIGIGA